MAHIMASIDALDDIKAQLALIRSPSFPLAKWQGLELIADHYSSKYRASGIGPDRRRWSYIVRAIDTTDTDEDLDYALERGRSMSVLD